MDERDIQAAIMRLKKGDIGGLESLVRAFQVKAVRTAYLITSDQGLAEDVVQAAFVRVYERIDQFDIHRPFQPWFMRIVTNAALQATKKQKRQISLDKDMTNAEVDLSFIDLLADETPGPETQAEAEELRDTVQQALFALSPDQRAVIVLKYYLDYSEREMAEELQSPPGTIKWRLHAARKQLGVLLRRYQNPLPAEQGEG